MTENSKWGSHVNIHRLSEAQNIRWSDLLQTQVFVSEKLDGSNLGFRVCEGQVVALQGRRHEIWTLEDPFRKDPAEVAYGGVKKLGASLIEEAFAFVLSVAERLRFPHVVVFGELMKGHPSPTWHPFGLRVHVTETDIWIKQMLTESMYEVFNALRGELVAPPPPRLEQECTLREALLALEEPMTKGGFEGVFIANIKAPCWGAKWKTGQYEEQPKLPAVPEDAKDCKAWAVLQRVYATRATKQPKSKAASASKPKKPNALAVLITESLEHELSKRAQPIIYSEELAAAVIQEALERRDPESGVAEELVRRAAPGIVRGWLRKQG